MENTNTPNVPMKSTGVVRQVDDLGRIVIPIELRRSLDIKEKDPVEIFVQGDRVILQKYVRGCAECGTVDVPLVGKLGMCGECLGRLVAESQVVSK